MVLKIGSWSGAHGGRGAHSHGTMVNPALTTVIIIFLPPEIIQQKKN